VRDVPLVRLLDPGIYQEGEKAERELGFLLVAHLPKGNTT
jgi:hypothetical protein